MSVLQIKWKTGDGYIYLSQGTGKGDMAIAISSDANNGSSRSQDVIFVAINGDGKTLEKVFTIHQYGVLNVGYDGCFAHTPQSDYTRIIDCGTATKTFDEESDTLIDGGNATTNE